MYIGTDLVEKTGLSEKVDKLDFTFSIHPKSIPFLRRYGILIDANRYTLHDKAFSGINLALQRLGDADLTLDTLDVDGREINASIKYNNVNIFASTRVVS